MLNNTNRIYSFKNAFTLIEILVVLSTIALLLGILVPILSGAKKEARRMVCKNNLRNIGLALQSYFNDWNSYPVCQQYCCKEGLPKELNIINATQPYLGNEIFFRCPDDTPSSNDMGWYSHYGNSYIWQNAYSRLVKGQKEGYLTFLTEKKAYKYRVPMVSDVAPNHIKLKNKPGSGIIAINGGGWAIESWILQNRDSLKGFNSVWPDAHVEENLGLDYERYLSRYSNEMLHE